MFGGAARGGKSFALLMAALQYVHVPGYRALLLRRTYADLNLPEALIPMSHHWLQGKASWNGKNNEWSFESGATLTFGYLDSENDKFRYQGATLHYIGFDELTQFTEGQYRYLFSRLSPIPGNAVPLRMRSASNPGGVGHEWVKKRFMDESDPDRKFIASRLEDNFGIDTVEYERSLKQLDPITRRQLRYGDWDIHTDGLFKREWFRYWKRESEYYRLMATGGDKLVKIDDCTRFMVVDCAGVEKRKAGHDPDFTVAQTWDLTPDGDSLLINQWRKQAETVESEDAIVRAVGRDDVPYVLVEHAHVGIGVIQHIRKRGIAVRGLNAKGSKAVRSQCAQIRMEAGTMYFPANQPWVAEELEPELLSFKGDGTEAHDDQADDVSYAALHAQKLSGAITDDLDKLRAKRTGEMLDAADESEAELAAEQREAALVAAQRSRSGADDESWRDFLDGDD